MSRSTEFEDRVTLAVVAALVGTVPFWVRGVAIRASEADGSVEVLFASAEEWIEIADGIAEFSDRLAATSPWLRHTTDHWIGPGLEEWPGRDARVVFAVRVPPDGHGMDPRAEFENDAVLNVVGSMGGAFGPEMWAVGLTADRWLREVDVYLAFGREPTRQDLYEIDEFRFMLSTQSIDTGFAIHVWVGDVTDFRSWPGYRHRRVSLQRSPDRTVPDDFDEFED